MSDIALRRTPLLERHRAAGARIVPFAGWAMPIEYTRIFEEHRAVRESAGLFDVSHMGEIRLRGRDALALAQLLFTNDIRGAAPGRVRYGLFLTESGGAVDDVTAYRVGESEVLFCVNASNVAKDLAWVLTVRDQRGLDCHVIDESDQTALLALQGPAALAIAHEALGDTEKPPARWKFRTARFGGAEVWLSRTGYTGEDGYEIYAPAELAVELWDVLVKTGEGRLRLAGLGARDTLRTEMAYPLYGHELDATTDPLSAGLERFVAFGSGFIGEPALEAVRDAGPAQRLVGLLLEGRAMARVPAALYAGETVGRVTSGTFAPSIERSIAIGYVPARLAGPGSALEIEVRGRRVPCQVCKTPFYSRKNPKDDRKIG